MRDRAKFLCRGASNYRSVPAVWDKLCRRRTFSGLFEIVSRQVLRSVGLRLVPAERKEKNALLSLAAISTVSYATQAKLLAQSNRHHENHSTQNSEGFVRLECK
jgi:hypothetical protein